MSFCMVGNVLIPPKEKAIVPNAKDNDRNVGWSYSAVCFSDKSVMIEAKIRTAPTTVADVAATATGLKSRVNMVMQSCMFYNTVELLLFLLER